MLPQYRNTRALPKAQETWDVWIPALGPSRQLHADFYGKHGPPIGWEQYRPRYLIEMELQKQRTAELAERVRRGETITLLCSKACEDEGHCHRTLLKSLIEAAVAG